MSSRRSGACGSSGGVTAGPTGPTGAAGAAGSASSTGATGPSGTTGSTGPTGTAGAAGSASSTGATGPAGAAAQTFKFSQLVTSNNGDQRMADLGTNVGANPGPFYPVDRNRTFTALSLCVAKPLAAGESAQIVLEKNGISLGVGVLLTGPLAGTLLVSTQTFSVAFLQGDVFSITGRYTALLNNVTAPFSAVLS
jgi:hypothetical protein